MYRAALRVECAGIQLVGSLCCSFQMAGSSRWRLDGCTALVTGGTKGIGKAAVAELCGLGARVFFCARNQAEIDACLAEWTAQGFEVGACACDVAVASQRAALLAAASTFFGGKLSFLFANAGSNIRRPTAEVSEADYRTVMALNLESTYFLAKECYPLLLESVKTGGTASIVFNSSVAGVTSIQSGSICAPALTSPPLHMLTCSSLPLQMR